MNHKLLKNEENENWTKIFIFLDVNLKFWLHPNHLYPGLSDANTLLHLNIEEIS